MSDVELPGMECTFCHRAGGLHTIMERHLKCSLCKTVFPWWGKQYITDPTPPTPEEREAWAKTYRRQYRRWDVRVK